MKHIDLLLKVTDLSKSLPYSLDVSDSEVALLSLSIPKTFENSISYMKVRANFIASQAMNEGQKLLSIVPTHDNDSSLHLLYEPRTPIFRETVGGCISSLDFEIFDENNQAIDFSEGEIMIILCFRKK